MGGKGSGRTKDNWTAAKYEGSARANQTPETKEFYAALRRQMGDRLFEIQRVYPSGKKAVLGTSADIKADTLGKMFGAGEYECFEVDRGTGEATSKPPVKRTLHPGKYPLNENFSKDPMDMELALNRPAMPEHVRQAAAAGGVDLVTREQIYADAKSAALQEFQRQQELKDLRDQVTRIELALAGGGAAAAAGAQGSNMANLRDMIALVKDLMPAPMPNMLNAPMNPADTVRQAVESVKLYQDALQGLGGVVKQENPALVKLIDALSNIATVAIPAFTRAPAPAQAPAAAAGHAPAAPAPAQLQQQAPAPAPASVATLAPAGNPQQERITMLQELSDRLTRDQGDQLATPARSHISSTVAWIRQRCADPAAGAVWNNLPTVLNAFSDSAVVTYITSQAPHLVDTEPKKNWLASVIDLLKKPA